jgi:hypothetical protein
MLLDRLDRLEASISGLRASGSISFVEMEPLPSYGLFPSGSTYFPAFTQGMGNPDASGQLGGGALTDHRRRRVLVRATKKE